MSASAVHPRLVAEEIVDRLLEEIRSDCDEFDKPLIGHYGLRYLEQPGAQRLLRDALEKWLEAKA